MKVRLQFALFLMSIIIISSSLSPTTSSTSPNSMVAGSFIEMYPTSSSSGCVVFGPFTRQIEVSDVIIIVHTSTEKYWGNVSWPYKNYDLLEVEDGPVGGHAVFVNVITNDGQINRGDSIVFTGLNEGSRYTFDVLYKPIKSTITMTGQAYLQICPIDLENNTTVISGNIKDDLDNPICDAVITEISQISTMSVITDSNGYFTIWGLAVGKHNFTITREGFLPVKFNVSLNSTTAHSTLVTIHLPPTNDPSQIPDLEDLIPSDSEEPGLKDNILSIIVVSLFVIGLILILVYVIKVRKKKG
jgi:hypothetical protein